LPGGDVGENCIKSSDIPVNVRNYRNLHCGPVTSSLAIGTPAL